MNHGIVVVVVVEKMADLVNLKRRRTANKNVVNGIIVKMVEKINLETFGDEDKLSVESMLQKIIEKSQLIKNLDEEILGRIEGDDIDEEIDAATHHEIKIAKEIKRVEIF